MGYVKIKDVKLCSSVMIVLMLISSLSGLILVTVSAQDTPISSDPIPADESAVSSAEVDLSVNVAQINGHTLDVEFYAGTDTSNLIDSTTVYDTSSGVRAYCPSSWSHGGSDGESIYWTVKVIDTYNANSITDTYWFNYQTDNDPPQYSDPEPDDGAAGVSLSTTLSLNVTDPEGTDVYVDFYNASDDSFIGNDTVTGDGLTSQGTASVTWSDVSVYNMSYEWYAEVYDTSYNTVTTPTYDFTTITDSQPPEYSNIIPTDGATGISLTPELSIDVSDPDNDNISVQLYNEGDASGDGFIEQITVTSGSTVSIEFTNATAYDTTYSYSFYMFENTAHLKTNQTSTRTFTTLTESEANDPPTYSNRQPSDGSIITASAVWLEIDVNDPDGDNMDVHFYNSSGYNLGGTTNAVNSTVDTYWDTISDGKTHEWYVKIEDPHETVWSNNYSFTVNSEPAASNPSPSDGEVNVTSPFNLSVDVSDPDGDNMDVTFKNGDNDVVIGTVYGAIDGSTVTYEWSGLSEGTDYSWYVDLNDGHETVSSSTWSFTTEGGSVSDFTEVDISAIDDTEVTFAGNVSGTGYVSVYFEYRTNLDDGYGYWVKTTEDMIDLSSGTVLVQQHATGLTEDQAYQFRMRTASTLDDKLIDFSTDIPHTSTSAANPIYITWANLTGLVDNPAGYSTLYMSFRYTDYQDTNWSLLSTNQTVEEEYVAYGTVHKVTGLKRHTKYYYKFYVRFDSPEGYYDLYSDSTTNYFITKRGVIVSTYNASQISFFSTKLGASYSTDVDLYNQYMYFEYGTDISEDYNVTSVMYFGDDDEDGIYLSDLDPNTEYEYRAVVIFNYQLNGTSGKSYGDTVSFTTDEADDIFNLSVPSVANIGYHRVELDITVTELIDVSYDTDPTEKYPVIELRTDTDSDLNSSDAVYTESILGTTNVDYSTPNLEANTTYYYQWGLRSPDLSYYALNTSIYNFTTKKMNIEVWKVEETTAYSFSVIVNTTISEVYDNMRATVIHKEKDTNDTWKVDFEAAKQITSSEDQLTLKVNELAPETNYSYYVNIYLWYGESVEHWYWDFGDNYFELARYPAGDSLTVQTAEKPLYPTIEMKSVKEITHKGAEVQLYYDTRCKIIKDGKSSDVYFMYRKSSDNVMWLNAETTNSYEVDYDEYGYWRVDITGLDKETEYDVKAVIQYKDDTGVKNTRDSDRDTFETKGDMFILEKRYVSLSFFALVMSIIVASMVGYVTKSGVITATGFAVPMFMFTAIGWLSIVYSLFAVIVIIAIVLVPQFNNNNSGG